MVSLKLGIAAPPGPDAQMLRLHILLHEHQPGVPVGPVTTDALEGVGSLVEVAPVISGDLEVHQLLQQRVL